MDDEHAGDEHAGDEHAGDEHAGDELTGAGQLRGARDLLGLPVYTIAEGRHLGQIDALLVRREDRTVAQVRLRHGLLGRHRLLPFAALRTVGEDIALVESAAATDSDGVSAAPADGAGLDTDLVGRPVLTPGGERVGELADFGVDTASGRIVVFRVRPDASFLGHLAALVRSEVVLLPEGVIHGLGASAVILRDEGVALLMKHPPSGSGPAAEQGQPQGQGPGPPQSFREQP